MEFLRASSWADALEIKAQQPEATPIAGGTDVMVEINFDHRRPSELLDLTGVDEISGWSETGGRIRIGAGMPYARIIDELGDQLPGLSIASRTVGSPQIRNRGTLGGNLASASPAGDGHPPLVAGNAEIEIASVRGTRIVPAGEFFTGVKRSVLEPDELIAAVHVPPAPGPQQFAKVGTRNAMVIAVCTFAVELDPVERRVGTGLGSAAPTPRPASKAAKFLENELEDTGRWDSPTPLPDSVLTRFGELVAEAGSPIDDVRGSADYRRHAVGVLARRTLNWAWRERRSARSDHKAGPAQGGPAQGGPEKAGPEKGGSECA